MQYKLRNFFATFALTLLASCGFHLRGDTSLPFDTLRIDAASYSSFATELKRVIEASSRARVVEEAAEAQAVLHIESETREKQILSLSGGGKVREFQLRLRVSFRLDNGKGEDFIPGGEILLKRDFAFNDTQILAKEAEEALLYRDMQSDAVLQMLRRLAAAKPAIP